MKIRIVKNDIIPFDGFSAMTFIPWIFCRKELKEVDVNHEMIHARQQEEIVFVGIVLAAVFFLFIGWWSLFFPTDILLALHRRVCHQHPHLLGC